MFKNIILLVGVFSLVSSNAIPEKRIVGGNLAPLGQLRSMVSLRPFGVAGLNGHFAGGVLISTTWTVSNAAYLQGRAGNSINVVAGLVDLAVTGTVQRSIEIVIHPHYDPSTRQNDIACVRTLAFPINANIQFSPLYDFRAEFPTVAHIAGWGATDPRGGPNSQFLRRLTVNTVRCVANPPTDGTRTINTEQQICAASNPTGSGFCTSDVGGPLISIYGVIGIASWHRNPCGSLPDVYTEIFFFRNWIRSVTGV